MNKRVKKSLKMKKKKYTKKKNKNTLSERN